MSTHRQALGVAAGLGRVRRAEPRRPLPGGQPVLPQLRLQGGHPGLPGHRRGHRAAAGVRRGRGHAADRGRADHRAARARPPSTRRSWTTRTGPPRPVQPAARGDRRGRRCRSRWSSGCAAELSFGTVLTAYGLTEAVVATMCRPGDDPETVARTSGRAAAGFEVRVAGPDGQAGRAGRAGRDPAPRAERDGRLPGRPGRDQGGHRPRRLAAHRRHRPTSTRPAT